MSDRLTEIAKAFHDNYERLAPGHGYATQECSRVPWDELPAPLADLMIATVEASVGDVIAEIKRLKADRLSRQGMDASVLAGYQTGVLDGLEQAAVIAEEFEWATWTQYDQDAAVACGGYIAAAIRAKIK